MAEIFIIQGIIIYIYGFDHNPPHLHIKYSGDEFTITIADRIVEGKGKSRVIKIVNEFIDEYESEILFMWKRAQEGETITKIQPKIK